MRPNPLPPIDLLRDLLKYDPVTGGIFWRVSRGPLKADSKAGSLNQNGYWIIQLSGKLIYLHRLAWALYHEEEVTPDDIIDHISGDKTDNRIVNLRKVTYSENNLNRSYKPNTSGHRGVYYNKHGNKKWQVKLGREYLGCYDTIEEALKVRQRAEQERGTFFKE